MNDIKTSSPSKILEQLGDLALTAFEGEPHTFNIKFPSWFILALYREFMKETSSYHYTSICLDCYKTQCGVVFDLRESVTENQLHWRFPERIKDK